TSGVIAAHARKPVRAERGRLIREVRPVSQFPRGGRLSGILGCHRRFAAVNRVKLFLITQCESSSPIGGCCFLGQFLRSIVVRKGNAMKIRGKVNLLVGLLSMVTLGVGGISIFAMSEYQTRM